MTYLFSLQQHLAEPEWTRQSRACRICTITEILLNAFADTECHFHGFVNHVWQFWCWTWGQ